MSRRLGSVAVAALAVAGAGTAVFPQHVATLGVLAAATVAVVAATFLLVLAGALLSAPPEPWPDTAPAGDAATAAHRVLDDHDRLLPGGPR